MTAGLRSALFARAVLRLLASGATLLLPGCAPDRLSSRAAARPNPQPQEQAQTGSAASRCSRRRALRIPILPRSVVIAGSSIASPLTKEGLRSAATLQRRQASLNSVGLKLLRVGMLPPPDVATG